ncbi:MAG: O-antigen ligase family protein [Lachnospiraceae bacterium]|nr:O-antigen ligase family protein [Lachnospiraceae bacterium]
MANKKDRLKQAQNAALLETAEYFISTIMVLYGLAMLVVFPLYFHNKYFDMGNAKYDFFKWTTVVFLGLAAIAWVNWFLTKNNCEKMELKKLPSQLMPMDYFVLAYFLISLLSYLCSSYKNVVTSTGTMNIALVGFPGWSMGFVSQSAFVLIYFFMSRFCKNGTFFFMPITVVAAFTAQLVILQRFCFNPLGMYTYASEYTGATLWLADEYIEKFVSTLGQTTWYSSFAILAFPISVYLYMYGETMTEKRQVLLRGIGMLGVLLSFGSLCTANSDGAYVGFMLALMVFFWFALSSTEKLFRFLEILIVGLGTFKIIGIFRTAFPQRMITLVAGDEKITDFVIHSPWMLGLLGGVLLIYIILRLLHQHGIKFLGKITILRKVMVWGGVIAVWLVILLIILTTRGKLPSFLEKLYDVSFFNFTDLWGNHRGFNWRMSMTAFQHASFKDIMIGVGPDCFSCAMDKYCYAEVEQYWQGLKLACAHNEFLNMLITQGVLGLISYLGIFISFLVAAGKRAMENKRLIPYMAAVIAYLGHNFFCYQQCICTPMVFIFMALGMYEMRVMKRDRNNVHK